MIQIILSNVRLDSQIEARLDSQTNYTHVVVNKFP